MIKNFVRLSIKNHWFFLGLILAVMWYTGEIMGGHRDWAIFFDYRTARQIHNLFSKLVIIFLLGLVFDKIYLYLKSKGKI